jgi:hypothetical protein
VHASAALRKSAIAALSGAATDSIRAGEHWALVRTPAAPSAENR